MPAATGLRTTPLLALYSDDWKNRGYGQPYTVRKVSGLSV